MFKKILSALIISIYFISLTGCAGTKTTTYTYDDAGNVNGKVVEEEDGTWKSENVAMFYEFEGKRVDRNAENVTKKIEAIEKQTSSASELAQTSNEKVLIHLLSMTYIQNISTTPPPSGLQAPKTATDMWGANLVGLGNIFLNGYALFANDDGTRTTSTDNSPSIINSGAGDVFYMSDNNKNPNYTLTPSGESSATFNFSGDASNTPTTTNTSTEGDSTLW